MIQHMSKVIGIDPGTGSFDICGLNNGKIFYEKSIKTSDLLENPDLLVNSIEEVMPLDLITGPSGYGVELTYLEDLDLEHIEDWYLTYILLLKKKDLEEALTRKEPGISVYYTMTETAKEMKRRNWPVCYIPGVINLPTVPDWRKINKLDIGTVDKLCSALLGLQDQSIRLDIPYSQTSFILVEAGKGYNAAIGVDNGKVVDGIGGTTGGLGLLTAGGLDLELVQLAGHWSKSDIFAGGALDVSGKNSAEKIINAAQNEERSKIALKSLMEEIKKMVSSINVSVENPKEILLSGRLTGIKKLRNKLIQELEEYAPVRKIGNLNGAKETKESAQGYAMVADGLCDGRFSDLIEQVGIKDAKGTALDYLYHPKGRKISKELREKIPFKTKN